MGRGALRRSVSLGAMVMAIGAGFATSAERALAACVTTGNSTTCNTDAPNPFTSRVGNGGTMSVTVNAGAGIAVTDGSGAIWNSVGAITNNGTIAASGGSTAAIRIDTNLHTNNGTITGTGVVAIERAAAATGIASFTNAAGATITATGVANAIVDLGAGTFTITNRGTINGGISMGPGTDNLNLHPGSVITGAVDGGAGSDALSLSGPGTGSVETPVSGFETLTVNSGRWTFNSSITGVTSSSIQNGGTLVLNAPSSITGQMFIRPGGTLETSAANFPASTIDNGGLVRFAETAGSATFSRTISGLGAVEKTGPGTLIFTGANSYSGGTTISQGVLQVGNGGTSGVLPGSVVNNASLVFNRSNALDVAGAISGTGSLTQNGTGVLTLSGANSYSGGTIVTAGVLAAGSDGALGAPSSGLTLNGGTFRYLSAFGLGAGRAVSVGGSGGTIDTQGFNAAIGGTITGSGGLSKSGTGTLTLTGNSSYSGNTTVAQGALQLGNGGAGGSVAGNIQLQSGTRLIVNRNDSFVLPGIVSGTGSLTQAGTGTTILTASNSYTGGTTIQQGTLQLGNGGTTGSITGNIANNGNLTINRSDSYTLAGIVSGTGSLTQAGTGTTILTAENSYTGGTTIQQGTLQLGNGGTSGSIIGNIANNGNLTINRSDAYTLAGIVSGTGSLTQAGTGTTILTADNSYTGGTTIQQGTLQLGNGGTTGSITGNVSNFGMLVFDRADTLAFAGVISGTGAVTQAGTGTTLLPAVQSYTGNTFVRAGTLAIGATNGTAGGLAGGGDVLVDPGARFGGYGTVAGGVTNRGTIAVADALEAFAGGPTGRLELASGLLNGGNLDLRGRFPGNRLVVKGGYAGQNGSLDISTVLAGDDSPTDQLVLDGGRASGTTGVNVTNAGGLGALTVRNGIRIIDAVNGATTDQDAFHLAAPVLAGPYRYSLYRGGKNGSEPEDWFLRTESPPDPPVPPEPPEPPTPDFREETSIYATLPGQALAYGRNLAGTLHERMGDSATGLAPGDRGRGWSRAFGFAGQEDGRLGGKATDNPDYDYALLGLEAGGDVYRAVTAGGTRQAAGLSGAFGRMGGTVRTRGGIDAGDTLFSVFTGGGYWTSLGASGWYVDARALASLYDVASDSFQDVHFDTTGLGLLGSLEAGYPLALAPGLVLEPQLQVVGQGLWLADEDDGHAEVSFGDATSLATRASLRLAYTRQGAAGFGVTVWARGDLWHDWLSSQGEVSFSSQDGPVSFHSGTDDSWLGLRVGVSALTSARVQLHGSLGAERSLDGEGFGADARLGAVFSW